MDVHRSSVWLLLLPGLVLFLVGLHPPIRARAEVGLGGGIGLYPLELTELKGNLEESGLPEALAGLPDLLPLPHIAACLRLGGLRLTLLGLQYEQLLDRETGLRLSAASAAVNLEAPVEVHALLFRLGFGLGLDLLGGEVALTAHDAALEAVLARVGLRRLTWLALNAHAMGEFVLALGPLQLYLLGRYLAPLPLVRISQGISAGDWQAEMGLLLAL